MDMTPFPLLSGDEQADIALILEGTYPFVRGGVSSWVHQLICGLPEYTFALVFIGDKKQSYGRMQYRLPKNVVHLNCIYILPDRTMPEPKARKGNKKAFAQIHAMHEQFQSGKEIEFNQMLGHVIRSLSSKKTVDYHDFLYSEEAWTLITQFYQKIDEDTSFLSYFWTVRAMHVPIFSLLDSLNKIPQAQIYHTISTGYAGLLATMIHHTKNRKVILTEHGIYTKERKIDLSQVDWIDEIENYFGSTLNDDYGYLRSLWIRFFESIGKLTYATADPVIALTEDNRNRQIVDGANKSTLKVISNGVDLERFRIARDTQVDKPPLVVGFIGRVVPIKDVKMFIRALHSVCEQKPNIRAWIIGGEDEDPKYASECRHLINALELEKKILYKGFCKTEEIMSEIGVVVLSSISEGMPLVILEAFASGRPIVATDVGACRELIEGSSDEDKALGVAGAVVNIADPEALAEEILALFNDHGYWQQTCTTAKKRVEKFYSQDVLFESYRNIYHEAIEH
jgi:glycosyltransferase involved in cell wall biosynthesis